MARQRADVKKPGRWARRALSFRRSGPSAAELRAEVIRLGPWVIEVELPRGVKTSDSVDAPAGTYPDSMGPIWCINDRQRFVEVLSALYPEGLSGRRVLDCACNCGADIFWAKDLGAGDCYGIDARRHWIDQARFLARHREGPSEGVQFETHDLYDLPTLDLEPFDITFFKGIFYHLPDPVRGLRLAADLTRELLILNTDVLEGPPGALIVNPESATDVISGVHGLGWIPTGAEVLRPAFEWCGFPHTRISLLRPPVAGHRARLEVLAARDEKVFADFDATPHEFSPTIVPPRP